MSRLLAIGDIHGCSTALDTLLEVVELQDDDQLVFLGDYIDRGPNSRGVIERLIALSGRPGFVALRGNHDLWLLRARNDRKWFRSWMGQGVGGSNTLESYGATTLNGIPEEHWEFLESTRNFYETERFIFAHAAIEGHLPLELMREEVLLWRSVMESEPHFSEKTLICGHTSQSSGIPLDLGHAICIDTHAYSTGGWLSCLEANSLHLWQANREGDTRQGWLGDFVL